MINGAVKFFDLNYALFKFGTKASASSNDGTVNSILDISRYTQWEHYSYALLAVRQKYQTTPLAL